ncbi:S-(hydroxymethyl)glutathione dehydrogenase/class III alcohol dehydrogenase, partial [Vibrio parahaemolyticus AQ3810]
SSWLRVVYGAAVRSVA